MSLPGHVLARIEIEHDTVADLQAVEPRAAHVKIRTERRDCTRAIKYPEVFHGNDVVILTHPRRGRSGGQPQDVGGDTFLEKRLACYSLPAPAPVTARGRESTSFNPVPYRGVVLGETASK